MSGPGGQVESGLRTMRRRACGRVRTAESTNGVTHKARWMNLRGRTMTRAEYPREACAPARARVAARPQPDRRALVMITALAATLTSLLLLVLLLAAGPAGAATASAAGARTADAADNGGPAAGGRSAPAGTAGLAARTARNAFGAFLRPRKRAKNLTFSVSVLVFRPEIRFNFGSFLKKGGRHVEWRSCLFCGKYWLTLNRARS